MQRLVTTRLEDDTSTVRLFGRVADLAESPGDGTFHSR